MSEAPSLTTALEAATAAPETRTVKDLIASMTPELEQSLQSSEAAAILLRHYYNAVRFTPALLQCTGDSLVGALLLSAQVRLEPGPLGHVYLVPYRNKGVWEVTWMLGYTGIIELGRRGGAVGLASELVWDCDGYVAPWRDERGIHFNHTPGAPEERNERRGVLVTWAEYHDGKRVPQALDVPLSRIERAKKASPAARSNSGPWHTDEDAMWRKTGVRAARPFLPLTTELATAVASDDALVRGVDTVEGEALPVIDAPDDGGAA